MSTKPQRAKAKGHHFVPRFLLNNFASRRSGPEYYVWQFRADGVMENNTRNVGKQKYFHGNPDLNSLESDIATEEGRYADLVRRIRELGVRDGDKLRVDEMIVHLMIRTKNLRDGFDQLGRQFWDATEQKLTATDKRTRREHRNAVTKEARKVLQQPALRQVLSSMPAWRRRMFLNLFRQSMATVDLSATFKELFSKAKEQLPERTSEAATSAQLRVLARELPPAKRIEQLATFSWKTLHSPDGDLILGDVVTLGISRNKSGFVHPVTTDDDNPLEAVILPVAPDCAILGSVGDCEISVKEINIASAELSRDFFVARQKTAAESELAIHLAARCDLISADDMRTILE